MIEKTPMNRKRITYWRIYTALVFVLIVITFTPLNIPQGIYRPTVLGIPYTLWVSGLITIVLVFLTYLGSKVHPGKDEEEEQV